ncbi:MAG TPA: TolC family protein [Chitinophaga sp.]|nr:TolC family protein [Chitinophaga sp.]
MKRAYITFMALCISLGAFAQLQQPDTSVLLKLPQDPAVVARFKQKLVELALQNPDVRQYDAQKEITKYDTRIAKAAWLNHLTAAGNLNEFTIKGNHNGNNPQASFYPRYNFGVLIPLGHFISIPNEVKRAKAQGRMVQKQQESAALVIKQKVLDAYEEYAANKQLVELHTPILEDALVHYNQVEEKFRAGDSGVPLDEYKAAYHEYNAEMVQKVLLEKNLRQSKLALEGIVGMTLEEVMHLL